MIDLWLERSILSASLIILIVKNCFHIIRLQFIFSSCNILTLKSKIYLKRKYNSSYSVSDSSSFFDILSRRPCPAEARDSEQKTENASSFLMVDDIQRRATENTR